MRDSQLFEVVNTGCFAFCRNGSFFRHSNELTFVRNARVRRDGEVTQMGLIDYYIGHVRHRRAHIFRPTFWVRLLHVDDSGTLTVDTHRFSEDARCFGCPLTVLERTNGVVFACQIALDGCCPEVILAFDQRHNRFCLLCREGFTLFINSDFHLFRRIGPEGKLCLGTTVEAFVL